MAKRGGVPVKKRSWIYVLVAVLAAAAAVAVFLYRHASRAAATAAEEAPTEPVPVQKAEDPAGDATGEETAA